MIFNPIPALGIGDAQGDACPAFQQFDGDGPVARMFHRIIDRFLCDIKKCVAAV
jgi:hypothetical protein